MLRTLKHAASVTNALMDDIYMQTGLTPHIEGTFLTVCDNHHGQYVATNRESMLPDGSSLMLVHDQTACGGEGTLLMDDTGMSGTLHSLAETSALVIKAILARQQVIEGLAPWCLD